MQIILTCLFILQNVFKSKQTSTDINFMIITFMYKLYDRANQNAFKMFQNVLKRKQTSTDINFMQIILTCLFTFQNVFKCKPGVNMMKLWQEAEESTK